MYRLKQTIKQKSGRENFSQTVKVEKILKGNRTFLKYDEMLDGETVPVILSIEDDVVRIMRSGPVTMKFQFVKGKLTDTVYETVAGRHRFKVYTTEVKTAEDEVFISYKLFENDEILGHYKYHLKKEA